MATYEEVGCLSPENVQIFFNTSVKSCAEKAIDRIPTDPPRCPSPDNVQDLLTDSFMSCVKKAIEQIPTDSPVKQLESSIILLMKHTTKENAGFSAIYDAVMNRLIEEEAWSSTAFEIFQLMISFVEGKITRNHQTIELEYCMETSLYEHFDNIGSDATWNAGLLDFLGRFCNSAQHYFHIKSLQMDCLNFIVSSPPLFSDRNFELFCNFFETVGPTLDDPEMENICKTLHNRVHSESTKALQRAAIDGLLSMRARGWKKNEKYETLYPGSSSQNAKKRKFQ